MTPAAFAAALSDLDLTQTVFADLTGVHKTTVSRWATGGLAVPKWAGRLMDAWKITGVPTPPE